MPSPGSWLLRRQNILTGPGGVSSELPSEVTGGPQSLRAWGQGSPSPARAPAGTTSHLGPGIRVAVSMDVASGGWAGSCSHPPASAQAKLWEVRWGRAGVRGSAGHPPCAPLAGAAPATCSHSGHKRRLPLAFRFWPAPHPPSLVGSVLKASSHSDIFDHHQLQACF